MSNLNTKQHVHDEDDWDKKSESDGEEVRNNDVLQAKSNNENPNKLKDLFDKSAPTSKKTQNKPRGDYNKDYKNKKPNEKGAPKFYNNSKNNNESNFDKPGVSNNFQAAKTKEPSKPEFTGSIKASPVESTAITHKVKAAEVKEAPKQEDIIKPEFKVKEGKLVSLNVNEDLYLKNKSSHVDEQPKYIDKTESANREENRNKEGRENKEYNRENRDYNKDNRERKPYIPRENRKPKDDGIKRDDEGYEIDEDGFHDINAKKTSSTRAGNNNYKKGKGEYKKKWDNNNYGDNRKPEYIAGIKGEIKDDEIKSVVQEVQTSEPLKSENIEKKAEGEKQLKTEIKFKNDGKGLKGLFK